MYCSIAHYTEALSFTTHIDRGAFCVNLTDFWTFKCNEFCSLCFETYDMHAIDGHSGAAFFNDNNARYSNHL